MPKRTDCRTIRLPIIKLLILDDLPNDLSKLQLLRGPLAELTHLKYMLFTGFCLEKCYGSGTSPYLRIDNI